MRAARLSSSRGVGTVLETGVTLERSHTRSDVLTRRRKDAYSILQIISCYQGVAFFYKFKHFNMVLIIQYSLSI